MAHAALAEIVSLAHAGAVLNVKETAISKVICALHVLVRDHNKILIVVVNDNVHSFQLVDSVVRVAKDWHSLTQAAEVASEQIHCGTFAAAVRLQPDHRYFFIDASSTTEYFAFGGSHTYKVTSSCRACCTLPACVLCRTTLKLYGCSGVIPGSALCPWCSAAHCACCTRLGFKPEEACDSHLWR